MIAGQDLAPQKESKIQMMNPHPHTSNPTPIAAPERSTTAAITPPLAVAHPESLLIEEIRVLRERGLTDECIHGLFSGFNIDACPEPSSLQWKLPTNDQLIRLIWGQALPNPIHLS
jgi:hypothetical protein